MGDQVGKPNTPAATPEPDPKPRRFRFKGNVDGKDVEEDLSEDEIQVRLSKAAAAEARLREAAELKRKFHQAVAAGRDNPAKAFKDIFGLDLDQYAMQQLAERYRESTLTPEEQAKRKLERERDDYKKQLDTIEAKRKTDEKRAFEEKVWADTERNILEALKTGGFEKSKAMLHLVADVAEAALDYGIELSPPQLVAEAQKRMQSYVKQVIPALKGPRLLEFLGDSTVKEVIRAELDRRKLTPAPAPKPAPVQAAPAQAKKPMRPSEFRRKHLFGVD